MRLSFERCGRADEGNAPVASRYRATGVCATFAEDASESARSRVTGGRCSASPGRSCQAGRLTGGCRELVGWVRVRENGVGARAGQREQRPEDAALGVQALVVA